MDGNPMEECPWVESSDTDGAGAGIEPRRDLVFAIFDVGEWSRMRSSKVLVLGLLRA